MCSILIIAIFFLRVKRAGSGATKEPHASFHGRRGTTAFSSYMDKHVVHQLLLLLRLWDKYNQRHDTPI